MSASCYLENIINLAFSYLHNCIRVCKLYAINSDFPSNSVGKKKSKLLFSAIDCFVHEAQKAFLSSRSEVKFRYREEHATFRVGQNNKFCKYYCAKKIPLLSEPLCFNFYL